MYELFEAKADSTTGVPFLFFFLTRLLPKCID